jgi:hypothetical protein
MEGVEIDFRGVVVERLHNAVFASHPAGYAIPELGGYNQHKKED